MDFLETVAFLGGALVGAIALAAVFLAMWRGAPDVPVFLHAMLSRQGDDVARLATASGSRDFALAVNQCRCCGAAMPPRAAAPGSTRASARDSMRSAPTPDT